MIKLYEHQNHEGWWYFNFKVVEAPFSVLPFKHFIPRWNFYQSLLPYSPSFDFEIDRGDCLRTRNEDLAALILMKYS